MKNLSTLYEKAFDVPYHLGRAHDYARHVVPPDEGRSTVERDREQKVWHLQAARAVALRIVKLIDERLEGMCSRPK